MTPQFRTVVDVLAATASSVVLFAATLAALTDLAPSRIAAYTAGWLVGCMLGTFILIGALMDALRYAVETDELSARTEEGAR